MLSVQMFNLLRDWNSCVRMAAFSVEEPAKAPKFERFWGVKNRLVLTRSVGERLFIQDGEIKIQVLEVKGNQVRIGIEAPKHIAIHREEVFDRIKTEDSTQEVAA